MERNQRGQQVSQDMDNDAVETTREMNDQQAMNGGSTGSSMGGPQDEMQGLTGNQRGGDYNTGSGTMSGPTGGGMERDLASTHDSDQRAMPGGASMNQYGGSSEQSGSATVDDNDV